MPVSNQQLDDFGIPIKKTTTQPEVDDFGIPIKKKPSGPPLPSFPSLDLPSASTAPPKRLTYTDINSSIEKLSKAQEGLRDLEAANFSNIPTWNPAGGARISEGGFKSAKKDVEDARVNRDKIFSEYSKEIAKPIDQLIQTQEYTKFFTPSGNIDYEKARNHFNQWTAKYGGGPALVEHWIANLKMKGQGELERKAVKPLFEENLKKLGLEKYADQDKYANSVYGSYVKKHKDQTDLIVQDRDQRINSILEASKVKVDDYTVNFNKAVGDLNEMIKAGAIDEQSAKAQYDVLKSDYSKNVSTVNRSYQSEAVKINQRVKQKFDRIGKELDALSEDEDLIAKSIPEADKKLIDKAYTDARSRHLQGKEVVNRATDEAMGIMNKGSVSSFLGAIASFGDALSTAGYSNKLVEWMQNKRTSADELKPAEYEWSKDFMKRAAASASQSIGASVPTLLPSILITGATGGTSVGVVGSALLSYYGENKQNAGQVYRDVLEQTGDVALARDSSREYFEKTIITLPLYFVGALGEKALLLGKGLKKTLVGVALELAEEVPVEYIQGYTEAVTARGYKGTLSQYISENPELLLDIAVGVGGQSAAMKGISTAFSKVAAVAPAPQVQTMADAILTQGKAFATRLVQTQFDQGVISEQKRDELFGNINAMETNLAKLDELGVRGESAKLYTALSSEMAELQARRKSEKDESVQGLLDGRIDELKTQMTGVLTGKTEYIVFKMPGDVNSKVVLASTFNALDQQAKNDAIRSAKSVTVVNNQELNQQLQDQKQTLGNPESAPDGAYTTDATIQGEVEQQAGPTEGGVQERPGTDGGQQEVGQGAGQQGQAPVTQPDTGDRNIPSEENERLKIEEIERRRSEELDRKTTAGYSTIAADYLFTGGKGVMLSTDYLLQALISAFPFAGKKIDQIRNKYAGNLGNIADDIGNQEYNSAMNEIRDSIVSSYNNKRAVELFDTILNNATGFASRQGNAVSIELDTLNDEQEKAINEKYNSEISSVREQKSRQQEQSPVAPPVAPRVEPVSTTPTAEPAPVTPVAEAPTGAPTAQPTEQEAALASELGRELRTDYVPIIETAAKSLQDFPLGYEILGKKEFFKRNPGASEDTEGSFVAIDGKGKILFNRDAMERADPGIVIWHEFSHPVINAIRNANRPLYDRMIRGLKQNAKNSADLQGAIDWAQGYRKRLEGKPTALVNAVVDDESINDTVARVAANPEIINQLPLSFRQTFIDFINQIAKLLGIKGRVTNTASADFRRMVKEISSRLKSGESMTDLVGAENVGMIDSRLSEGITDIDGNPVDNSAAQFKVSGFQALINGITFKYLKDSKEYNDLKSNGYITEDKNISDFDDGLAMLHAPDHAFSGEMIKDGKTIVEGKGGVFYPLKFHDLGYFWASTKNSARSMAKKLNELRANSPNGKIRLVLVSAREEKVLSSTSASSSVLSILLSKAFDRRAKITKDQVIESYQSAIESMKKEAAEKGEKANFVFSGEAADFAKTLPTISKSDSRVEFENKMNSWLSADISNFDQRKVLNEYALGSIAKMITDSKAIDQVFEFFSGVSGRDLKSTGRRLSKANLVSGFSNLLTEPMLKGSATTGDAYAVIELDADVEAVKSDEHKSYPYALKSKDPSKKVVVHILQDRKNWTSFTVDPETGSIVTKERMNKVMDTKSGVSRPVQFNFQSQTSTAGQQPVGKPEEATGVQGTPQLSIGGRQAIVDKAKADGTYLKAPNGKPTKLTEDQWATVRTPEFKNWFGDWEGDPANASKVVDENGEPMVVYHGTGTTIEAFDPSFTGKGNDQYGSGFYFTTNQDEAVGYTGVTSGSEKIGGIDSPNVVDTHLNIRNPIKISGTSLRDSGVKLTQKQAFDILMKAPNIMDAETSPVGDFSPAYWDEGPTKRVIMGVAKSFVGENLVSLENDFFKDDATAFRQALNDVLGYDGVVQEYENGTKHYIAWFPNQIKSATANVGTFSTEDARIQFSAGPRAESRVEFKLVAFVLRKRGEGLTDQQIALAINSALPAMPPADIARLLRDPNQFLIDSFPGMTPAQHLNLIERAKIANMYRAASQINIHPFFKHLRVDPDVAKKYYDRAKTRKEVSEAAISSIFNKAFSSSRGLPNWMMQAKEFAQGLMKIEIANAKATLDKVRAVAAEIGFTDWELFRQAMIDTGAVPANGQLAISSGMPATVTRLPLEMQPLAIMMRDQIDALTSKLIASGYVTPEQAVTLQNNIGQYVNRAFRLFTEKNWQPSLKDKNAAIDFLINEEYQRLLQEFYDKNTTPATGQTAISGGPTVGGLANIPYIDLMEQAGKNAQRRVEDILNKKSNPYFGDAKVEARSIGILKQRQEIPIEIRRLMGEYTDPGVIFMMTIVKQSALAASSQYLKELRTIGLGTIFFEKNDPNRPSTHSIMMASEGSSVLEPLNGLYTTKDVAEGLQYIEPTYNAAASLWMKGVGYVRMGKTILSPVTMMINFISNLGFEVFNGTLFTKSGRPFGAATGEAFDYMRSEYSSKRGMSEVMKKVIKLNLVGQSVDAESISRALSSGDLFEVALDVSLTGNGVFRSMTKKRIKPLSPFEKAYRMGDDFWKVYAYVTEREMYSKAKFKKEYSQLTLEEQDQVDVQAAERVKMTRPTFDRMFPAVKWLNQNIPLLADFTGFSGESIRTPINTVKLAIDDMKDPDLREAGIRRISGVIAYVGIRTAARVAIPLMLGYGVTGLIGKILNDEEEEEKLWTLQQAAPPYMYNHDMVAVPTKGKPHLLTVVSMNSNDPLGWSQLSVNSLVSGTKDMSPGALAAIFEISSKFFGLGMTTEAMIDVMYNRNSSTGDPIYSGGKEEEGGDSEWTKIGKSLSYLWGRLEPSAFKLKRRWSETTTPKMEVLAMFGYRTMELDLHKSYSIQLSLMSERLVDINGKWQIVQYNEKSTEKEKEDATKIARDKKAKIIDHMHRMYRGYIKLGADPNVMSDLVNKKSPVKMTGMDKKTKSGILDGGVDPTTLY